MLVWFRWGTEHRGRRNKRERELRSQTGVVRRQLRGQTSRTELEGISKVDIQTKELDTGTPTLKYALRTRYRRQENNWRIIISTTG